MKCSEHQQIIKFICSCKTCLQGLCKDCCGLHQKVHKNAELIPITKAITMAEINVTAIKKEM